MRKYFYLFLLSFFCMPLIGQDYFLKDKGPFDPKIPSPEEFLGYPIGTHHTRHDLIVAYLQRLADLSDKATLTQYGQTYEYRKLVMLTVSTPSHLAKLEDYRKARMPLITANGENVDISNLPIFVNLGYNVHGNEPSSSEAAMLTAYILVASQHADIKKYLDDAVVFIDPTINPDGRDRHSHWANMYKGSPMVADPMDVEHNEGWPRGRTNHYWFDLNRDWLLGVHPESRGKLGWYHQWYPNVVTDFHEMGTNSTYFFEPMKAIGSKDPIMPKENYTTLNETFAEYFAEDLDKIGSFYFTKERFDGTYPGYGSSYPDLQGGLGLLFEQASSRGHVQRSVNGKITFAFTIRNQLTSSLATLRASVENKELLYKYQKDFFESALNKASASKVKGYVFGDAFDENRTKAFIDFLLLHQIKVYPLKQAISRGGKNFEAGKAYVVPTKQVQYRMVQTMFETYSEYTDSVFYDASAWSVANFYNMPYAELTSTVQMGDMVTKQANQISIPAFEKSSYAYLISWDDYYAPAVLNQLQEQGISVKSVFKPFAIKVDGKSKSFSAGTLLVPVQSQKINEEGLYNAIKKASEQYRVPAYTIKTGYSTQGIDLGSNYAATLTKPKVLLLVGDGVSSYEAGEVWHLLDQRVNMPITKLDLRMFNWANLDDYNTLLMVSGRYAQLDSAQQAKISAWVRKGNVLITSRTATSWAINTKLVNEELIQKPKDKSSDVKRLPFINAPEIIGKKAVGGAIFKVDLDLTHPLAFGYHQATIPVYRNSTVWLSPSKNPFSTVAKYTENPHIDGFITEENLNTFLKPSASIVVSGMGQGRAILFADNPNFRGAWYGTNRLFLNAIFLGKSIYVPRG